jgi:hypothetical protein
MPSRHSQSRCPGGIRKITAPAGRFMAQLTLNQAKVVLAQHGITVIPKIEYDDLCARAADGHGSQGQHQRDLLVCERSTTFRPLPRGAFELPRRTGSKRTSESR